MDYVPDNNPAGWTGRATKPTDWECRFEASTAEEACSQAHKYAVARFGPTTIIWYEYTLRGWTQAAREEEDDEHRLACPLCNSKHPQHADAVQEICASSD